MSNSNTPPPKTKSLIPEPWEFAGWGTARRIENLPDEAVELTELGVPHQDAGHLGELSATAICGNDITSSVLYVSALTIGVAGLYAPIGLLLVAAVLYIFRKIYGEVGSALPLNGGAYTALLNTTNKKVAATAATITVISYLATAVISANEAMHYLHSILSFVDPIPSTIALLALFAGLSILGISESAKVAVGIFIFHLFSLTFLVGACIYTLLSEGLFDAVRTAIETAPSISPVKGIFFGFCAGMLGISGFESSANFIEEQKPGVFPKTLRNMWVAVSVFNPLVCILALLVLGAPSAKTFENSLLSELGSRTGGDFLRRMISIDAVLVLSGAVLTSYVGVTGLVRRMALDRCLPQFLLTENKLRRTNHWIILGFFALSCAVLLATNGEIALLAGVYSLSFLAVMVLFAFGNILLKNTRARLPRSERAKLPMVVLGMFAVGVAFIANATIENIETTLIFISILGGATAVMFSRVMLLRFGLFLLKNIVDLFAGSNLRLQEFLYRAISSVNSQAVVYFTKGDDIRTLNRAALYVLQNEQTNNLLVIHIHAPGESPPKNLASDLSTIDRLYPQLRIDFISVNGAFGPQVVEKISRTLDIPKNYMFIGTPGHGFIHSLPDFGGVRIIV
jgi:amino acid transporter